MATSLDVLAGGGGTVTKSSTPVRKAIKSEGGTVDVIPYNANLDKDADKFLAWFWRRLLDDGLIRLYYPDMPEYSFAGFVKLFSGDTNVTLVVKKNEQGEIVDTIGFATLELMSFGMAMAAHAGFIFLPEYWDQETTKQAAERIMEFWFQSEQPKLDVVIGIIAERNVMARRFLQRIGWTHSGNIPFLHQYQGERSDSSIWYVTRLQFEALKGGR